MEVKKRRGKEIKPREEGDMAIYGALVFDHVSFRPRHMAWPCSCPMLTHLHTHHPPLPSVPACPDNAFI